MLNFTLRIEAIIYDLLDSKLLHEWKDKIEETEHDTWFFTRAQEAFEKLEKELNDQEKELLKSYSLAIENKLDYIYYNLKIKILSFGIKIGIELEKAFAEYE